MDAQRSLSHESYSGLFESAPYDKRERRRDDVEILTSDTIAEQETRVGIIEVA
jgi:hypothetical protein